MGITDPGSQAPPRLVRRITHDVKALSMAEREALGKQLYPVHCQIFSGVSESEFKVTVLDRPAERNLLQLYINERQEVVGYCAVHRIRRRIGGRAMIIMRSEAGLHPAYRRRATTIWFVVRRLIIVRLLHPFASIYLLASLVHPSGYHVLCKYFPRVFPRVGQSADPATEALARELSDSFHYPPVSADDPFIRQVGWVTIEGEAAPYAPPDSRHVRYFEQRNPGYRKGEGLVVLVPLTFGNLGRGVFAVMVGRLRHALGLWRRRDGQARRPA